VLGAAADGLLQQPRTHLGLMLNPNSRKLGDSTQLRCSQEADSCPDRSAALRPGIFCCREMFKCAQKLPSMSRKALIHPFSLCHLTLRRFGFPRHRSFGFRGIGASVPPGASWQRTECLPDMKYSASNLSNVLFCGMSASSSSLHCGAKFGGCIASSSLPSLWCKK
jgi:hypothetical protein